MVEVIINIMTQKEKIIKSFMALQSIKSTAQNIITECSEYSSTASSYANSIVSKCDEMFKIL